MSNNTTVLVVPGPKVVTVLGIPSVYTGPISPTRGGTGLSSYVIGDLLYASASNALAALAGNTTATRQFLTSTGTGSAAQAPAWAALAASDIPTGIDAAKIGGGTISNAEFACLDGATSPLQAQLDTAAAGAAAQFAAISVSLAGKANTSHTHSAADITSGVVAPARLGSGTPTSATLLDGSGAWRALAASDLGSGTANNSKFLRGDGNWSDTLVGPLSLSGPTAALNLGNQGAVTASANQCVGTTDGTVINSETGKQTQLQVANVARVTATATGVITSGTLTSQGDITLNGGVVYLSTTATPNTLFDLIGCNAGGPMLVAGAGRSSRVQVGATVVANFGSSEGVAGTDRFAVGRYAVGAIDGTKSGLFSNGTYMIHNADNTFGHYFRSSGNDNVRITNGLTSFFAPAGNDYSVKIFSKSYYPALSLETDATSPAGAGTWGVLRGYAGNGLLIYGNPRLRLYGNGTEQMQVNSNGMSGPGGTAPAVWITPVRSIGSYQQGANGICSPPIEIPRGGSNIWMPVTLGSPNPVQTTITATGVPGGWVSQFADATGTNTSGNVYQIDDLIPVDPTRCYEGEIWSNTTGAGSTIFVGCYCYNSAGTNLGTKFFLNPLAIGVVTGVRVWRGTISGEGVPGTSATWFITGTTHIRLIAWVQSAAGAWTIQVGPFRLREVQHQTCLRNSTAQSISSHASTNYALTWNTQEAITSTQTHSTSTNPSRWICPRSGRYLVNAYVEMDAATSGIFRVEVWRNGSVATGCSRRQPNLAAYNPGLVGQCTLDRTLDLVAGDYLELAVGQDSGASLNATSNCYFQIKAEA